MTMTNRVLMLTIPYPPSQNGYLRRARGGVYQHPAARQYKQGVALLLSAQKVTRFQKPEQLSVTLRFYRPRAIGDLDNLLKLPFDALNGMVWDDDSQIVTIRASRHDDKQNPRVEVTIEAC